MINRHVMVGRWKSHQLKQPLIYKLMSMNSGPYLQEIIMFER